MTKIKNNKLLISEDFYSIQGEGITSGYPAYFIRLANCNLSCGSTPSFVNQFKKGNIEWEPGSFQGDLHEQGKASWTCFVDSHKINCITGSKKLNKVRVGDRVLGYDENTKLVAETTVIKCEFEDVTDLKLLQITSNGKKFTCTKDHLFFVQGGWKRADQLNIGDELYHLPSTTLHSLYGSARWREYSPEKRQHISDKLSNVDKGYMYTPEYKLAHQEGQKNIDWAVHSNRMRENNPMRNIESARKSWSNRHSHKISGCERKILNLDKEFNWGLQFVGTGSFWVENQNPDFIIPGTNKIIEVYDSSSPRYNRGPEWEQKRTEVYSKHGYSVLYIDFFDKLKKNSNFTYDKKYQIAETIQKFIMNGIVVENIKEISAPNKKIAKIECFPHKNYFVEGVLSHNCDTIPVWARGTEREFQYLIDRWKAQGIYEDICKGIIHIIWTGGEPTIPAHQESIVNFMDYFQLQESIRSDRICEIATFNEIETNGTLYIDDPLFYRINQINCSPKLSNSGMSPKMRIVEKAIRRIMEHDNYQFKFVISTEDDVFEMFETFIKPFDIPLQNVCCMPGLDAQEDFHDRTKFVLEMAKKYKFIGLTRLHVSAWDKTVGV